MSLELLELEEVAIETKWGLLKCLEAYEMFNLKAEALSDLLRSGSFA